MVLLAGLVAGQRKADGGVDNEWEAGISHLYAGKVIICYKSLINTEFYSMELENSYFAEGLKEVTHNERNQSFR